MANWFMKGGPLVRPDNIPIDIFLNELSFYRLRLETISEFLEIEGLLNVPEENEILRNQKILTLRMKMWDLFESPESSLAAKIIAVISVGAIICSTTIFCLETIPSYRKGKK